MFECSGSSCKQLTKTFGLKCPALTYLRIDIKHVGVDEGGQGKNMTRVCRLRSVFGMEERTCV